eukprot:CAMPEP_0179318220 /NCGR_PEP_ID=MMETSP0797-20121207/56746_1 /TAXON_ID=47934 /ORGANISM="Dinophysis acuminata, Strain DAEP01" /LENGTH=45 /DNA_ID= /DNA_START= /DNA_END= /DNA_ORIENTATION=
MAAGTLKRFDHAAREVGHTRRAAAAGPDTCTNTAASLQPAPGGLT